MIHLLTVEYKALLNEEKIFFKIYFVRETRAGLTIINLFDPALKGRNAGGRWNAFCKNELTEVRSQRILVRPEELSRFSEAHVEPFAVPVAVFIQDFQNMPARAEGDGLHMTFFG